MKQKNSSLHVIIAILFGCALLTGLSIVLYKPIRNFIDRKKPQKEWAVVFVHGSFNFPLGLLNAMNLFSDTLENTTYAQVINRLRKEPFFQQEQPILDQGLIKVQPHFDCPDAEYKFAAFPIIKSYEVVQEAVAPALEKQTFYTFGWSGLLSQRQRRHEAVRLYNALLEKKLPSIRLISHSHGGNLCLNLALINRARKLMQENSQEKLNLLREKNKELGAEEQSCLDMIHYLEQLPSKASAKLLQDEQRFDYQPQGDILHIQQLLTLGNPIQEETASLYSDKTFSLAINFYSTNDNVQGSDRISTKSGLCSQQLPSEIAQKPNVKQVKIMVDNTVSSTIDHPQTSTSSLQRFWHLLSGQELTQNSIDHSPTHKDLWFFGWSPDYCQTKSPLYPLPVVVLLPLIMDTLAGKQASDFECNIGFSQEQISSELYQINQVSLLSKKTIPRHLFDSLQEKCALWKPHNLSKENVFHAIHTNL